MATKDDFPQLHRECRGDTLPLNDNQDMGFLKAHKAKYESGIFLMKRCHHCSRWVEGNTLNCKHCSKDLL